MCCRLRLRNLLLEESSNEVDIRALEALGANVVEDPQVCEEQGEDVEKDLSRLSQKNPARAGT